MLEPMQPEPKIGSKASQSPILPERGAQVAEIERLSRTECFARWEAAFGSEPPPRLSVEFMRMALAYEFQCNGSKPDEKHSIEKSKDVLAAAIGKTQRQKPNALSSGAELVREWNGRTHRVRVIEGAYEYGGETYASLSAIAREITGTRWSGPRFFGVKS